jgi:signal transduction histidine kinase
LLKGSDVKSAGQGAPGGSTFPSRSTTGADQVFADPDRLEQVVENLFANALRHTPEGGVIALSATAAEGAIVLTVIDSGEGIPDEHVAHVFDRFYKADQARTGGGRGSGLGLSIAKAIVERHLGMIEVTSVPGRTVFTITLPGQAVTPSASANVSPAPVFRLTSPVSFRAAMRPPCSVTDNPTPLQ